MAQAAVPVTMGSPRSSTALTDGFRIIEAWFPPGATLDAHTHDRAVFGIMLGGGFRTEIGRRSLPCDSGSAWTEPNAEKHANYVGSGGAHVLVIQADPARAELIEPLAHLLDEVHLLKHPAVLCAALRLVAELRSSDLTRALSMESYAVSALATAAGLHPRERSLHHGTGWLRRARERLHDEWRMAPSLSDLASSAGVHPCHLAHIFRERVGESVGTYVQRLRVTWAVEQLLVSDRSISQIALDAGFYDQSHFTRLCQRFTGLTPAAYRTRARGGKVESVDRGRRRAGSPTARPRRTA